MILRRHLPFSSTGRETVGIYFLTREGGRIDEKKRSGKVDENRDTVVHRSPKIISTIRIRHGLHTC
ncbi:MAG: hypothetical protein ACP5G0_06450 [Desulfomonilia bacterium]